MKQRVRVVGIIKTEDGVLILKRSRSRNEGATFWELPTGKINFGEQPEEAMTRALSEYVGITVKSLKIKDVITFLALEGSSRMSNLYIIYDIKITDKATFNPRGRYSSYKFIKDFPVNPGSIHLNEASLSVLNIINDRHTPNNVPSSRETANSVAIYIDGASRGNPGPAGIGYYVVDSSNQVIAQGGEFIGFATSRVAEYFALKKGIEMAIDLGYKTPRFLSDSLMVVNQMNGIFQVKNQDILPIYQDIQKKLGFFDAVSFTHIHRTENVVADHEANLAIDKIMDEKTPAHPTMSDLV